VDLLKAFKPPVLTDSEKKEFFVKSQTRILPYLRLCVLIFFIESVIQCLYRYMYAEHFEILNVHTFIASYNLLVYGLTYLPYVHKFTNILLGALIVSSVYMMGFIQSQLGIPFELFWVSFFLPILFIPLIPSFLTGFCTLWLASWLIYQFALLNDLGPVNLENIRFFLIYYGVVVLVIAYIASIYRINGFLMEKQLEKAKADADSANQAKTQLINTVSHEVRTPLNGILGIINLLKDTRLSAKQTDYIETIRYSGEAQLTILNDILDISKIEAGKFDLEYISFNPKRLMDSVFTLMQSRIVEKGLNFQCIVDDSVPQHVKSDPTRIRQVLLNLISNATKFTEKGGIILKAEYRATEEEGHGEITFEVQDTGMGISEEGQSRLFQEFSQTDASISRKYGGTGLGLSICKRLVELMGGQIGVTSEVGGGSTFWFKIPAEKTPILQERAKGSESIGKDVKPMPKFKILVVEDNQINQQILGSLLSKWEHEVNMAQNGKEAVDMLSKAKEQLFDVVFMDMEMPVMGGIEAAREIRKLDNANQDIPMIALTANVIEEDQEKCREAGMNGFLTKPISLKSLQDALMEYGRHHMDKN